MQDVDIHRLFLKVEFRPGPARAQRLGDTALAYPCLADVKRWGLARAFCMASAESAERIVRIHDGAVDAAGQLYPLPESVKPFLCTEEP